MKSPLWFEATMLALIPIVAVLANAPEEGRVSGRASDSQVAAIEQQVSDSGGSHSSQADRNMCLPPAQH
jgi:hypothetical protein